jgi:hypothetical protein
VLTVIEAEPNVFEHPVVALVNVILAVPPVTPVTTPPLLIVATAGLELIQVPLVVGVKLVAAPIQTVAGDGTVIIGNALTVIEAVVLLQVVVVFVNVKVEVPANNPVTTPALVTEAIVGLLLIQVPPDVGDNVMVLPTQTGPVPETIGVGRIGSLLNTADEVDEQVPNVAVTV